jgi:hypothetical protein
MCYNASEKIVGDSHPEPRWFDRVAEYADAFQGAALPVEPFVYTWPEVTRLLAQPGLLRTARRDLVLLAGDQAAWDRLHRLGG